MVRFFSLYSVGLVCTNSFTFCSSIYYQKVFVFVAGKKGDHFVCIPLHTIQNQQFICKYQYIYSKKGDHFVYILLRKIQNQQFIYNYRYKYCKKGDQFVCIFFSTKFKVKTSSTNTARYLVCIPLHKIQTDNLSNAEDRNLMLLD